MTQRNGIKVLQSISAVIMNGENCAMKHLTQLGSNEFTEAIFPVPKNAKMMYKS